MVIPTNEATARALTTAGWFSASAGTAAPDFELNSKLSIGRK